MSDTAFKTDNTSDLIVDDDDDDDNMGTLKESVGPHSRNVEQLLALIEEDEGDSQTSSSLIGLDSMIPHPFLNNLVLELLSLVNQRNLVEVGTEISHQDIKTSKYSFKRFY